MIRAPSTAAAAFALAQARRPEGWVGGLLVMITDPASKAGGALAYYASTYPQVAIEHYLAKVWRRQHA